MGRAKAVQQRHEEEAGGVGETHPASEPETHHTVGPRRTYKER